MPITFKEVMDFHPANRDVYQEIRGSLGHLLPFVGAGLTAEVYGTWGNVLRELGSKLTDSQSLDELDRLLDNRDYFGAADLLEERRGVTNFMHDLVHHFSPTKLDEHWDAARRGAVWLMPDLFECPVLTTNFDQAIERVYRAKGHPDFEVLDPTSRDIRGQATRLMGQPCVFKLHGTVAGGMADYDRLVFTQAQYERHYGPRGDAREALQDFVGKRALLFLGCSLEGDRTVAVLREMAEPGVIHYAVVSCDGSRRDERIRELAEAGIRAIVYEEGRHESVRVVLEHLFAEQNKPSLQDTRMPPLFIKGTAFATVFLGIVVAVSIILFRTPSMISIVSSRAIPYTLLGYYTTKVKTPPAIERDLETEKAFSILSFLQETGDGELLVEAMRMDVSDLNSISEPVVKYDADIKDDIFYIFAINDGWGPSNEKIHLMATKEYPHKIDGRMDESLSLDDLCKSVDAIDRVALPSGGVCRIARLELDMASFLKYGANDSDLKKPFLADLWISVVSSDNEILCARQIVYKPDDGISILDDGGAGSMVPRVTIFGVLDVDKGPQSICFEGPESSELVDGWLGVETAVAPTKSCEMNCKDVFTVGNEELTTEEFHVKVTVPYYDDVTFGLWGEDSSKIMQAVMYEPDADSHRLKDIIAQYRYRPESVVEQQRTSYATEGRETAAAASTVASVQEAWPTSLSESVLTSDELRSYYETTFEDMKEFFDQYHYLLELVAEQSHTSFAPGGREVTAATSTETSVQNARLTSLSESTSALNEKRVYASAREAYESVIEEWRRRIAHDKTVETIEQSMSNNGDWYYSVSPRYVSMGLDKNGDEFVYCYQVFDAFDTPTLIVADPFDPLGDYRIYGIYQYIADERIIAFHVSYFRYSKWLCEDKCLKSMSISTVDGINNTVCWAERPSDYSIAPNDDGQEIGLEFTTQEYFQYDSFSSAGEFTDLSGASASMSYADGFDTIDRLHPVATGITWYKVLSDFIPPMDTSSVNTSQGI